MFLSVVETLLLCEDEVLQDLALRLLVATLNPSTYPAFVRAIRLSGLLITLAWMLGHSSTAVQTEALRVYQCVRELSSPSDLVRVMIEQGCVVVLYLVVDSRSSDGKELLQWVVSELEGQPQLLEWGLDSVAHSTNARLQRNILLSLLFLSHSSAVVRSATTEIEEVLKASLTTSEDNTLAMGVLAAATLSCDPRSTVRLDAVSMTRSASTGQLPTQSTGETLRAVRLVCRDGTVCYSGSQYDLLVAHCKQLRRLVLIQTAGTVLCVDLTALETTKSAVELLVAILKQPEQRDAVRFVHAYSTVDSVTLLRLSKSLDCLKGWHTATLGLTMALDSRNWMQTLDDALLLRHPALMLRTLRFVLSHPEALDSDNMTREPLDRATMRIWDELRANCV
ncbi:hypothetical protein Poli38472_014199 [Pythium oligandrum]|uniref:Uncharacterized protein n=1 Tax=Pythium oligandrum TaxID=41045 RepID=A0A8K1FLQ7_PYTOL|nr:hypothetical protein Poli38472_014199 [Pythium oligandrum]|eukprot:TMW64082.1 hypothetical protein Poli38472_014199 [Pythium oligandrum]